MKKIVRFFIIIFLIQSCNDGDFDIPSFDFEGKAINNCGNELVLFKLNESEVLILETGINNTSNVFFTTARENQEYNLNDKIIYRIFNDNINTDYFCQDIPPSTPIVNKEWEGSGTLIVTNTITDNNDGTSNYVTNFTISNLNLTSSSGNTLIFESYDFETKTGSFTN